MKTKNHIAIRYNNKNLTFCGLGLPNYYGVFWADAIKAVKSNPDYKGIKFCKTCENIWKKKRIRQLTVEECKKA